MLAGEDSKSGEEEMVVVAMFAGSKADIKLEIDGVETEVAVKGASLDRVVALGGTSLDKVEVG